MLADNQEHDARDKLYALALTTYSRKPFTICSFKSKEFQIPFQRLIELLRTNLPRLDYFEAILPSLQATCLKVSSIVSDQAGDTLLPKVLDALLASCLQNIEETEGNAASLAKIQGNLLAATILLGNFPETAQVSRSSVDTACESIARLSQSKTPALRATAITCLRSFALRDPPRSIAAYCLSRLFPHIVNRLLTATTTSSIEGLALIKLVGGFATSASEQSRESFEIIVLPSDPSNLF